MIRRTCLMSTLAVLLLLLPALVLAAGTESIRFESSAAIEVTRINPQGQKVIERQPANLVLPGTVVIYSNSFTNTSSESAEQLVITNPIPTGMEYVTGSATRENATLTFSIDGGKSFAPAEKLLIADPAGKRREAEAKDYTHIRWTLSKPLPPGGKGQVEFGAKLK